MAKNKKGKKHTKAKERPKRPRQQRLPGVDDPKIESIHNAAMDYAEIRDERQELTKKEVDLKDKLHNLMKENNKTTYKYNGVEVRVVIEKETVKVRVKKESDEAPAEATAAE